MGLIGGAAITVLFGLLRMFQMLDMPMVFALYALVISCSMLSRAISCVNRISSESALSSYTTGP